MMILLQPFILPMYALAFLIEMPYLAFIPTALLAFLGRKFKSKFCFTTATLWGLYTLYELYMHFKCTGECNIRIDLLFIYPLLTGFSIVSLIKLLLNTRKKKTPDA
jgi:hypothetical protein